MMALKYLVLTVGVVALIGVGAYAPMFLNQSTPGSTTTSNTCTTSSATTQTTDSTTFAQGSFSYSPSYPVKIESVNASTYQGANGTMVTFAVAYENVGSSNIYTLAGCGSSLTATLPQGTGVLKRVTGGPVCLCAEAIAPVPPGGNRTSVTPGCWTVYKFQLVHPGTVQVDFTLDWGPTQGSYQSEATNVIATFTFA